MHILTRLIDQIPILIQYNSDMSMPSQRLHKRYELL
jgi:hypothetical protein